MVNNNWKICKKYGMKCCRTLQKMPQLSLFMIIKGENNES